MDSSRMPGGITFSLRPRAMILAGLSALCLALGAAGPASAFDDQPSSNQDKLGCPLETTQGKMFFPHGTTMTVDMGDGTGPETYTCDNGKWSRTRESRGGTISAAATATTVTLAVSPRGIG
jgi:hypothetical protein